MTGPKDLGDGSAGDRPRRLGRYRLSRLFLNVYFLAMGSFIAIAFVADFSSRRRSRHQRRLHATLHARHDRPHRGRTFPPSARRLAARHQTDRRQVLVRLDIVDRRAVDLDPAQQARLDAGEYAIDSANDVVYHRLRNSKEILVVGR